MKNFLVLLIALVIYSCSDSQNNFFEKAKENSRIYITDFMKTEKVPGMQVAVSYKNDIIYSEGFGEANLEFKIPVNAQHKFRIASVSKPVAAVLTARLYQSGIIDIDKTINQTLSEFSDKRWDFTVRQLITHAAGIRHYLPKDSSATIYHDDIQNGLNIVKDDTLLHKPGFKFSYSSYGYNIAGAYIEKITGRPFEDLLVDSLFIPLKMSNSAIDDPFKKIQNRTSGYELNENLEIVNARFFDNRYKIPAGGMLSTAEDLALFGNELLFGNYLDEESLKLLFTPYTYSGETESDTGFGWVVTKDENGNKLYGHLGGITGGCSAIMIYPDKELVVVWLGNLDTGWSAEPTISIANYFLEAIQ